MEANGKEENARNKFENGSHETDQKTPDGDSMQSDTENDDPGPLANSNSSDPDQADSGDEKSSNKGQGPSGEDL